MFISANTYAGYLARVEQLSALADRTVGGGAGALVRSSMMAHLAQIEAGLAAQQGRNIAGGAASGASKQSNSGNTTPTKAQLQAMEVALKKQGIKGYKQGGSIKETGIYKIHKGERVLSVEQNKQFEEIIKSLK